MIILHDPQAMQALALSKRGENRRIAFVPTMGALHEGHLRLIDLARERGDFVVVSVFVNPIQFGPKEDFAKYPRTLESDAAACAGRGADVLFAPSAEGMYGEKFSTHVDESLCSRGLCGEFRPGHFRGVTTVVHLLFNIVQPHVAIFGAKDAQQCAVIRKMVADLRLPVAIEVMPTVRETDGLALSSRNRYLPAEARAKAPLLYAALLEVREAARAGERSPTVLKARYVARIGAEPAFRLQYFELCDPETMRPVAEVRPGATLALVAAYLGETRLIDNLGL